jgi:hypothetical protein
MSLMVRVADLFLLYLLIDPALRRLGLQDNDCPKAILSSMQRRIFVDRRRLFVMNPSGKQMLRSDACSAQPLMLSFTIKPSLKTARRQLDQDRLCRNRSRSNHRLSSLVVPTVWMR